MLYLRAIHFLFCIGGKLSKRYNYFIFINLNSLL